MDKGLIFNKRVGPNKHVGWNFLKTLIKVQLGSVPKNLSKITIRNKIFLEISLILIDYIKCSLVVDNHMFIRG